MQSLRSEPTCTPVVGPSAGPSQAPAETAAAAGSGAAVAALSPAAHTLTSSCLWKSLFHATAWSSIRQGFCAAKKFQTLRGCSSLASPPLHLPGWQVLLQVPMPHIQPKLVTR